MNIKIIKFIYNNIIYKYKVFKKLKINKDLKFKENIIIKFKKLNIIKIIIFIYKNK
jgi:hypothetical protein